MFLKSFDTYGKFVSLILKLLPTLNVEIILNLTDTEPLQWKSLCPYHQNDE